eukprot:8987859-Alexandrium_andersonii.AAC.1
MKGEEGQVTGISVSPARAESRRGVGRGMGSEKTESLRAGKYGSQEYSTRRLRIKQHDDVSACVLACINPHTP